MSPLAGPLSLHGRVVEASNGTFLGTIGTAVVVYKPIRGERPLWDFPGATLAHRERAARVVSEALGWNIVPETVLRDGPHGPGMVQRWHEPVQDQHPVDIVPTGAVPTGFLHVFDGVGANDRPVQLVHEDTPELFRMAVFDVIINNADRKGGHVLAMADGHRYGIDHGIAFHTDPKLRTVLWGWAGEPVEEAILVEVESFLHDLPDELEDLLGVDEVEALIARATALLRSASMPHPSHEWPAIPWPPF